MSRPAPSTSPTVCRRRRTSRRPSRSLGWKPPTTCPSSSGIPADARSQPPLFPVARLRTGRRTVEFSRQMRPMASQALRQPPAGADSPAGSGLAQDSRVTPMMAQYIEIKAANPDSLLFYRMGDFYELFFEDAEIASQALGIVLTKRGRHQGQDIPMCGVPVERADDYLQRLIGLGHRVAVCEQTEDPAEAKKRGSKSVVRRDVVRLVTPGTITEERLLEPGRANYLLAIARRRASDTQWCYGLAALDISTGQFALSETDGAGLPAEIARFEPREILVPDVIHDDPELAGFWRETGASITPLSREGLDPASAERRLKDYFGVATLDAFGSFSPAEITAAGSALFYVEKNQIGSRPALNPPAQDMAGAGPPLPAGAPG